MNMKVTRRYALGKKQKEIIEAWLNGEVEAKEAAEALGKTRDVFKAMVASMVQHMVTAGDLDVSEALKRY